MNALRLRSAVRLLTIIPVAWDEREADPAPANTIVWFPIVGLAIGAVLYAALLLPLAALPRAALCLAVWIVITGGLHEDGVMDAADAALAPVDVERRTSILKDPHVGAHGVTVAVLLLIARFAALSAVSAPAALLAPVVGRWSMALTLSHLPPHSSSVLGAAFARTASAIGPSVVAAVVVALVAYWQGDMRVGGAAAAGLVAGFGAARWLVHRLGGVNGDVHGASGVIAETITLYVMLPA